MKSKKRYGLIGNPLGHSLSPYLHQELMAALGINGEYLLYDIPPHRFEKELPVLLNELDGFNCTIPYKQAVLPFLRDLAPSARLSGAVNTVAGGVGHNTDGVGFRACGVEMAGRSVVVLGAGGVARVLALEADRAKAAAVTIAARNPRQAATLAAELNSGGSRRIQATESPGSAVGQVLLSGVPVGMWPRCGDLAAETNQLSQALAVFDAVYNPTATRLVLKAKTLGIPAQGGLKMLLEQALAAQLIWNPQADYDRRLEQPLQKLIVELSRHALKICPLKLLLTGFMGSGKTTVGRLLSQMIAEELPFIDLDAFIVQKTGLEIPALFARDGESGFRALEQRYLKELLETEGGALIATGGGALVQPQGAGLAHQANALVINLDVSLATALARTAGGEARPLLAQGMATVQKLYNNRRPLYRQTADLTISAEPSPSAIAKSISAAFSWQ